MLVLTRKLNERIRIGSSVTITVVRMKGKSVRLGIEAPADVSVLRGELAFQSPEEEAGGEVAAAESGVSGQTVQRTLDAGDSRPAISQPHSAAAGSWPVNPQKAHSSRRAARETVSAADTSAQTTGGWSI